MAANELLMPALSPTMESGTLAKWLVKEGDSVQAGDRVAEVETDKATMEMEALSSGIVTHILIPAGTENVLVGTALARLGSVETVPSQKEVPPLQPAATLEELPPISPSPAFEDPGTTALIAPSPCPGAVNATPLAKRIAHSRRLDISGMVGSGPRGKIMKADLEPRELIQAPSPRNVSNPPPLDVPFETIKLSGMRRTIARRLANAKQSVPHFYLGIDVTLDEMTKLPSDYNTSFADKDFKASLNDFFVKALALALEQVPDANVQFGDDELYRFRRVDVSVAVAVPRGLLTPIIKDAGNKPLKDIATEAKMLADRARAGQLSPEEYQGGTVSLSNLGMFGVKTLIPVVNAPQALIVGIGAAQKQYVAGQSDMRTASVACVTGSFDHRVIDGALAAEFMQAFKWLVEHPIRLLT